MLDLYQFEGCPYCARVREALDEHGLDYVVRTEPRPHDRRTRVRAVSGQTQVPVLVDSGSGRVIAGSEEIVDWLDEQAQRRRS